MGLATACLFLLRQAKAAFPLIHHKRRRVAPILRSLGENITSRDKCRPACAGKEQFTMTRTPASLQPAIPAQVSPKAGTFAGLAGTLATTRIDWVDYAKGICIVLVVMMHSTLGVEKAVGETGLLSHFIEWARPFRMPDFFMISGLFLARRIAAPWPRYADSKIIHFAYFYVLWMTIQFLLKGYGIYAEQGLVEVIRQYALGFIEPFGTLWFIYLLAVFFAVTKWLDHLPPLAVFAAAALLEILPIATGWTLIDEFAARYVYFFVGYWFSSLIFRFASETGKAEVFTVINALVAWAALEAVLVFTGVSTLPFVGLLMGFVGAAAVVSMGVLLAKSRLAWPIAYLGANSIVVYLAFFLFMAASRAVLIRLAPGLGVDVISLLVTASGVVGPVILHRLVMRTPLKALFVRPQWARLASWSAGWHTAGHASATKFQQELRQTQAR